MSGRASLMVILGGAVGLFALYFGLESSSRGARLDTGRADAIEATFVAPGPLLVALETLDFFSEDSNEKVWRATSWDALTGKRLSRAKDVPWRGCSAASQGLLWCRTMDDGLEVVSVPSLTVRTNAAGIEAKLGQKVMNASRLETDGVGRLRVTLADGRHAQLDAESLSLTLPEPAPKAAPLPEDRYSPCPIADSERQGLCVLDAAGRERRVDHGEGYLRLHVLGVVPGGVLLLISSSLDDQVSLRQVVRLAEPDFKEVGRATLTRAPGWTNPSPMWVSGRDLVLLTMTGARETIALETRTLTERWRAQH